MSKRISQRRDPAHISFRITNPAVVEELAAKAALSGSSPNLIVREMLTEGLTRPDEVVAALNRLNTKVDRLDAKLKQLDIIQHKLERGIHLLLRYAGKLDASQAKTVMERFFASGTMPTEPSRVVDQENGPGE